MKNLWTLVLAVLLVVAFIGGCDLMGPDGKSGDLVAPQGGYFYLVDRASASLVMLDARLAELKRWDLFHVMNDSSFQGITCDGKHIWLSFAGNADRIAEVDASGDQLVILNSFDAPPLGRGTIRDVAWDGSSLWALNSGSTTYATPPALYRMNAADGAILAEYPVPSPEPRGLTFVSGFTNSYGSGTERGLYYTDVTTDMVYLFRTDRPQFDTAFHAPQPPGRQFSIYPVGITNDGLFFWVVNSSGTLDELFKISHTGKEEARFDIPYAQPGPVVWTAVDVRIPAVTRVLAVSPTGGTRGTSLPVDVLGEGFRPGSVVDFGAGIVLDSLLYVSQSHLHTRLTIASSAPLGKRSVTVSVPGGSPASLDSAFDVVSTPVLTGYLWLVEQDLDSLYRIRVSDTTVVQQWDTRVIAPAGSPQGLASDGANIWLCASGTDRALYRMNTSGATLSVISSFPGPTPAGILRGIVYDGGFLWIAVSGLTPAGRIYKVDPASGAVADSVNAPGLEPRGITIAGGKLYCNDTTIDSVFAYDFGSKIWRPAFAVPVPPDGGAKFSTGLTWDGASFWMANSSGASDYVWKLSPGGVVLQYFGSPRRNPVVQLTGLVHTPN
jgi:hypothetical protein